MEKDLEEAKPQTRGMARREAMLDAATELFLEHGFERTSLSDIVAKSKGSRSTLYEQFGNKEGLLRAMIERHSKQVWEAIDGWQAPDLLTEESLNDLANRFVRAILRPDALAIYRIVAAESRRIPEIGEIFHGRGPKTVERRLADRFREALRTRNGAATPEQLAVIFLGAVFGIPHAHRVLGIAHQSDEELESHIRVAVRVFLEGIGRPACHP